MSLPLASTVAFCPASRANLASDVSDGMSSCLLVCVGNPAIVERTKQEQDGIFCDVRTPLLLRMELYLLLLASDATAALVPRATVVHFVQKMPLMFVRWHRQRSCVTENAAASHYVARNQIDRKTTHARGKFNTKMMDGEE